MNRPRKYNKHGPEESVECNFTECHFKEQTHIIENLAVSLPYQSQFGCFPLYIHSYYKHWWRNMELHIIKAYPQRWSHSRDRDDWKGQWFRVVIVRIEFRNFQTGVILLTFPYCTLSENIFEKTNTNWHYFVFLPQDW